MKVLSLIIAAGLLALANAHGCPPLWTKLGGTCFRYFGFPRPMRIAERVCAQFTSCSDAGTTAVAHLASISSAAQNTFLYNLVESVSLELPPPPVWIGLNDLASEGRFSWPDGTPFLYKNWARGSPNNGGNSDCVAMPAEQPGAVWFSVPCGEEFSYICSMPADTGPETPGQVDPSQPAPYAWGYAGSPYIEAYLDNNYA
ncbi:echinoidin-like [Amphiura filiformis]|uniref:echinoidin-like n=1 Tax=Amphiura filiformis TaxID=82378 RepID=UPI003B215092